MSAVQTICQQFDDVKVLMLSTFDDAEYLHRAVRFGAIGYLLKDTNAEALVQAIRMAYQGYTQFGPGLYQQAIGCMQGEPVGISPTAAPNSPAQLPPELLKLTKREQEVLCHIITGATNRQIAKALFISERTVKNHVTSILSRLNLPGRVQAAMFASPFLPLLQSRREQT